MFVQSAMRPQQFPILLSDLLDEILSVQLAAEVDKWVRSEIEASSMALIHTRAEALRSSLELGRSHSFSAAPNGAR